MILIYLELHAPLVIQKVQTKLVRRIQLRYRSDDVVEKICLAASTLTSNETMIDTGFEAHLQVDHVPSALSDRNTQEVGDLLSDVFGLRQ